MTSLTIRDPKAADEAAWRRLWAGYIAFYEADVPEEVTAATWSRILDPDNVVASRLAVRDGVVVGFANHILHAGTWTTDPICYLEDLFVDPDLRGAGVGKALIDDLIRLAERNGWDRVYWQTHETNSTARRLYDRYRPASGFIVYQLNL